MCPDNAERVLQFRFGATYCNKQVYFELTATAALQEDSEVFTTQAMR